MSRVNHVSVSATDLAASTAFYERLLGAVPVATPDFGLAATPRFGWAIPTGAIPSRPGGFSRRTPVPSCAGPRHLLRRRRREPD